MSAFTPQLPPVSRLPPGELLGKFVPTALRRTPPVARFVHPIRLSILGLLTAGVLPYWMLQTRVYRVQKMYAHQAELAGDLLVMHAAADEQKLLRESADKVDVSRWVGRLSRLVLIAAVVAAGMYLLQNHWTGHAVRRVWLQPLRYAVPELQAYVVLMTVAYLLLVIQMNRQIAAMQRLAIAVNGFFDTLPPIAPPPLVLVGRSPLTLLLGLTMAWIGLVWALPMAIAWSAFSQFVRHSAYEFRVDLSERLQAVSGVTPVIDTGDLCPNAKCRSAISQDAAFCPRCGTTLAAGAER